ncbi:MAG TPA: tubulin-like doman-containing protein [Lacipirellulaceae bacterium]|nr:tubulin-like doman-containing protein [Lacipirellulaceae bacterium]
MSTGTQVCDVVLPGYTLVDRIGSGGYADVWRAEAPGGIQKAVKVVHGYCDDEFASQELKALERVKGVRHPFLLSLERFEVVNGRLAILTELADMSLDQRRRQCCADGLSGIPREELLRYLADTAEALDFLSQRHSLLHLDIKPENLLILGDHIKVADFGLVKELASRTQNSLVSGLTPTYASPEMFDDEPSAQSDQYSLAIVYQQMLVGTLPFPGRTAAQLAKQHTQAEPQLMSLPAEDRPIVARALAKKPTDRFPTCRAFVDALAHRGDRAPAVAPVEVSVPQPTEPSPAAPSPSVPAPDDTKPPSFGKTLRREEVKAPEAPPEPLVTQPVRRGAQTAETSSSEPAAAPLLHEETVDVAVPEINPALRREQPTLYIAIGGIGIQVLGRLRALNSSSPDTNEVIESIALDTDRDELREACSKRWKRPFDSDDTLHIPLRLPMSYDNSREILGWVSRRWLYNIPRSLETRGYRPLGRVALVDHAKRVLALVDQKLERLANRATAAGEAHDSMVRIVIVAGAGGGTGAGMVIDVANAARSLASKRNLQVQIQGFFICPCFAGNGSSPLAVANTYALLTELNHTTARGNESRDERLAGQPFESRGAPFDCVYIMPSRPKTGDATTIDTLDTVAKYLAWEKRPEARAVIRSCRGAQTPREQQHGRSLTIKTIGFASLADRKREFISDLAVDLAAAIKRHWLTEDSSENWEQLILQEQQANRVPKLVPQSGGNGEAMVVAPPADATPLALRGRFKEHLKLQFTSEVLRQVQQQLERRDERGRPLIIARDARLIADAAAAVAASLRRQKQNEGNDGRNIPDSAAFRSLIAEGSRRVLARAVEHFDLRQPERFLPADAIDEILVPQCQALLEESYDQPDVREALSAMLDFDQMLTRTIEHARTDLLQCGADRRTLFFVPKDQAHEKAAKSFAALQPQAAVIPADVDDAAVVTEYAGIAPRSLAFGLMRVHPGIADAAHRLLTRTDIDWQWII